MIDAQLLARHTALVSASLSRRGVDVACVTEACERVTQAEAKRRELETHLALVNRINKQPHGATAAASLELKEERRRLQAACVEAEQSARVTVQALPNLPLDTVPDGLHDNDNRTIDEHIGAVGQATGSKPRAGYVDSSLHSSGARVAGAGFEVLRGEGARLLRALANFTIALHVSKFEELSLPALVSEESMIGSGHLPKFANGAYSVTRTNLWLAPTAEVAFLALHRGDCIDAARLPIRYMAHLPCFRREIGGGGSAARHRLHQYHQVELFSLCHPSRSADELAFMLNSGEEALRRLEMRYRVVELCCGQLPFSAAKAYKLEVFLPVSDRWIDVSTVSLATDFLARGSRVRMSDAGRRTFCTR